MDSEPLQQKKLLSSQDAQYTRLIIFVSLFLLSYGYVRFLNGHTEDVTLFEKVVLAVIFFSFFLSIFEGLFMLYAKVLSKRIEFDDDNLYVTGRQQLAIPMKYIYGIEKINLAQSSRGRYSNYEITYSKDGNKAYVSISVYRRKKQLMTSFIALVKGHNPVVEVKEWEGSIESLARVFRRKPRIV
jgi:hypothetical protein